MTNLTTLQSRAAFYNVFINDDVKRFGTFFEGKNANDLIAGFMVFLTVIMVIGRLSTNPQITMVIDLTQAIVSGGKLTIIMFRLLLIVLRAVAWGVFGI